MTDKIDTSPPGVSESLSDKSEEQLRELKAKGMIVYRLRESKDGNYLRALDDTIYEQVKHPRSGTITLIKRGRLNADGDLVPINEMSKRERSKMKRKEKRNEV